MHSGVREVKSPESPKRIRTALAAEDVSDDDAALIEAAEWGDGPPPTESNTKAPSHEGNGP